MKPVKMKKAFLQPQEPSYSDIFRRIYNWTEGRNLSPLENALNLHRPSYINSFARMNFDIITLNRRGNFASIRTNEYVFVCLLKCKYTKRLVTHYVSKEYNLFNNPYKAGRFIFEIQDINRILNTSFVDLAEEPAEIHEGSNFNIELYYLEIRKYRRHGKTINYTSSFLEWVTCCSY